MIVIKHVVTESTALWPETTPATHPLVCKMGGAMRQAVIDFRARGSVIKLCWTLYLCRNIATATKFPGQINNGLTFSPISRRRPWPVTKETVGFVGAYSIVRTNTFVIILYSYVSYTTYALYKFSEPTRLLKSYNIIRYDF